MTRRTPCAQVVAVASGKGGVGKSQVAVNLAFALARQGRRTMLVDVDTGLANAAILLGRAPTLTLDDWAEGSAPLDRVIVDVAGNFELVPGGSDGGACQGIGADTRATFARGFRHVAHRLDYLLLDTPSGPMAHAAALIAACDRVLLVLTDEPTAFMDGYATAKRLVVEHGVTGFELVASMVDDDGAGRDLARRFADVARRFLPAEPHYLGAIPRDEHVRRAVLHGRACLDAFPDARASTAYLRLGVALDDLSPAPPARGASFFGVEALHGAS